MAARKEQSDNTPKASVNMEELRELIELLRDNGLAELELERADFRVRLRREGSSFGGDSGDNFNLTEMVRNAMGGNPVPYSITQTPMPPTSAPAHHGAEPQSAASEDQGLHIITSPIVGTFYRSPSPTADPFVKIGSNVEPASVVCIIEAMKLMNEIQAEASGEVVKIYVENGQPVEYGQPLFGIRS
ncbi:MAG TPA: acetyl-CoA carboxylase biotin carboxyl carrier protein [Pyrinomonadaceae bacterium]|nr:acetyl-CoA carboxylase biotin carboxyl carrier protein [Pyrinomonadaceae bacterium]